jgi:hypothetical protein
MIRYSVLNSWYCIFRRSYEYYESGQWCGWQKHYECSFFFQFVRVLICKIMFLYWAIEPPTRTGLLFSLGSSFFLWYLCYILYDFTNLNIYKLWNQTPSIHMHVPQEESSVFWEVIVPVILSKELYMYMCPIPNGLVYVAVSSPVCRAESWHEDR